MNKILLVEDDGEIAAMLKEFLEMEHFQVEIAPDGERACEMFSFGDYRLVLLDLMIPKISDMEVMKRIRKLSIQSSFQCDPLRWGRKVSGHGFKGRGRNGPD